MTVYPPVLVTSPCEEVIEKFTKNSAFLTFCHPWGEAIQSAEMIVLAESVERLPESASRAEVAASIEAARLVGATVFPLEPDFLRCGDAEGALAALPYQSNQTPAVWLGYIPTPERYAAIYEAARAKNVRLVQTLEEHLRVQELDQAYPYLSGLTPETRY